MIRRAASGASRRPGWLSPRALCWRSNALRVVLPRSGNARDTRRGCRANEAGPFAEENQRDARAEQLAGVILQRYATAARHAHGREPPAIGTQRRQQLMKDRRGVRLHRERGEALADEDRKIARRVRVRLQYFHGLRRERSSEIRPEKKFMQACSEL